MSDDLFDIPVDVVNAAEEMRSFKLARPENARRHRKEPNTFFWPEAGVITSAGAGSYLNERSGQTVSTLEFRIEINAEGSGLNANKSLTTTLRINNDAIKTGEPKPQHTMSLLSVGKLTGLFRALGVHPDRTDGGYSGTLIGQYFPPATDQFPSEGSPLVGETLYFEVKQGPRELQDGSIVETPEINKILEKGR